MYLIGRLELMQKILGVKMKEHSLAIPFDVDSIHESLFERIFRKIGNLTKAFVRRFIDIVLSLIGIILLIPINIIVFFQNIKHK